MHFPRLLVFRYSIAAATTLLIILFAAAPASAEPWPIRNFQVVEMTQDEIENDTGGILNDAIDSVVDTFSDDVIGDPARAEQRAEIERYLGVVALQLEAWGFPPPKFGRVVELENGELAYRVYSVISVGASYYIPSNGGEGANAGHLRLHLVGIRLSQNLDFQDYATIAHELFHAVQYNTRFFSVEPGRVGAWITEGQAEAVGEDLAWAYAPHDVSRNTMSWGRRNYSRPLAIALRDPGGTGPPYGTASFWRYLAERDHLNLTAGWTVRPGIANPAGAVKYSYLASLLSNPPQPRDCRANDDRCPLEIQWLNAGLRGYDNFQQPLRKIFPEFAVTVVAYGDPGGRVPANNTSGVGADYWRSGVLPDCVKEIVDEPMLEYTKTLRLHGVSARCVVIPDLFNDQAGVLVEARASSSELLDQIVFGLAGDPKHAKPLLTDRTRAHGVKSAVRSVHLTPGRDTVLVFANVAVDAPQTKDQELEIIISQDYAKMSIGGEDSASDESDSYDLTGEVVPEMSAGGFGLIYDPPSARGACLVNLELTSEQHDYLQIGGVVTAPLRPGRYQIVRSSSRSGSNQDLLGAQLWWNSNADKRGYDRFFAQSGILNIVSVSPSGIAGDFSVSLGRDHELVNVNGRFRIAPGIPGAGRILGFLSSDHPCLALPEDVPTSGRSTPDGGPPMPPAGPEEPEEPATQADNADADQSGASNPPAGANVGAAGEHSGSGAQGASDSSGANDDSIGGANLVLDFLEMNGSGIRSKAQSVMGTSSPGHIALTAPAIELTLALPLDVLGSCAFSQSDQQGYLELLTMARGDEGRWMVDIDSAALQLDASAGIFQLDLALERGTMTVRSAASVTLSPDAANAVRGEVTGATLDFSINQNKFVCDKLMNFSFLVTPEP